MVLPNSSRTRKTTGTTTPMTDRRQPQRKRTRRSGTHPSESNSPCREIFAALSAYLDGELRVRDCRELEQHLQGCPPCLAYLESLKTTVEACGEYQVADIPKPSPRVRAALRDALRKP